MVSKPKKEVIMIGLVTDEIELFKSIRSLESGQIIVDIHNSVIQKFKVINTPYRRKRSIDKRL